MCLAVPGKIIEIDNSSDLERSGIINFGTLNKKANLAFVPEAKVGDYVLIHAGIAISIIQEEEANQTFLYLESLEEKEH